MFVYQDFVLFVVIYFSRCCFKFRDVVEAHVVKAGFVS